MTAPTILDRIRLVRCLHRVPLCSLNRQLKRIKLTVNHHCVLDKVRHRLPHLSNPNNVATKIFHNRTARAVVVPTLNELVARQRKQLVPVKINMYSIHLPNLRHRPEQERLHRQRVINYKLLQLKRVEPLPRGEFPVLTVARYYLDRPVPVYQVPVQNPFAATLTSLNSVALNVFADAVKSKHTISASCCLSNRQSRASGSRVSPHHTSSTHCSPYSSSTRTTGDQTWHAQQNHYTACQYQTQAP